jgi:heptosyltransferase II
VFVREVQQIKSGLEWLGRPGLAVERATQVLIVKLGWTETLVADQGAGCSLGDVLRTTPLLHLFRDSQVTWLTDSRAADLLPGKPFIEELLHFGPETYGQLAGREFDQVINLECDARLTDILGGIRYKKWFGFPIWTGEILGRHDQTADVKEGLLSGIQKGKTWPEILFEMVKAEYSGEPMILGGVQETQITHDIGFNIKVGAKWPTKAWPEENWGELAKMLDGRYTIGYQEHLNNLSGYVNWVNQCRLLVTNDSLGMHIAQALGKKVVALFGPTSFETVPQTEEMVFLHARPLMACQPCYRMTCDRGQECMRKIGPDQAAEAIERLMGG